MSLGLDEVDFAVIDFETTGLSPYRHDRVVEVAIVRLVAGGRLTDEFESLINPGRDLGPTQVHGISAKDILDAPTFGEIIGDVLERLANAVIAAHNVQFDKAFLVAECKRAGYSLPDFPTLCTMRLSSVLSGSAAGRALPDCCAHFGVDLEEHHVADDDARACAHLLAKCLAIASEMGIRTLDELLGTQAKFPASWPRVAPSGKSLRRSDAERLRKSQPHYLARLVTRLMGPGRTADLPAHAAGYMGLLDKVLEDRLVTEVEEESLYDFAKTYGLTAEQVVAAHRHYLEALAQAAWTDGVVTDSEKRDLLDVTKLLGFDQQTLSVILDESRRDPSTALTETHSLKGRSVCFTGVLLGRIDGAPIGRAQAEKLASDAGLILAPRVTKSLDILVVADPQTLSGKAKKAREYRTRIMAEMAFWNAIGVSVG